MAAQTSTALLNMKPEDLRVNQGTHVDGEMVESIRRAITEPGPTFSHLNTIFWWCRT